MISRAENTTKNFIIFKKLSLSKRKQPTAIKQTWFNSSDSEKCYSMDNIPIASSYTTCLKILLNSAAAQAQN